MRKTAIATSLITLIGGVSVIALIANYSYAAETLPSDCSVALTPAEIAELAEYWIEDSNDPDFGTCTSTLSNENLDALEEYLESIEWSPEPFTPDPTPTPGWGLDSKKDPDRDGTESGTSSDRSGWRILDFTCTWPQCWKQAVEKGAWNTCPSGYDCVGTSSCYETTVWCDDDEDIDYVCSYNTNETVNNPDSARIYGTTSNRLQGVLVSIGSLSGDGDTRDPLAHICIASRLNYLVGMNKVRDHLRFRHDHTD